MAAVEEEFRVPPGNWLAREIRRFNDQSKGLFPSPQPGEDRIKYNTIYSVDFRPLSKSAYRAVTPQLLRRPNLPKQKEAPFDLRKPKKFNSWNVRPDMTEVEKVKEKVAERRRTAQQAATIKEEKPDRVNLPNIERAYTEFVDIRPSKLSGVPERSRFHIETPILPPGNTSSSVVANENLTTNIMRMSAPPNMQQASEVRPFKEGIDSELVRVAEQHLEKSPFADRRVIDKALQLSNQHFKPDLNARSHVLPDPKREANLWLEQATEQEREVALEFFRSISGMRLMGLGGSHEHVERLRSLLDTLEKGTGKVKATMPTLDIKEEQKKRHGRSRLQFVKLLSPKTRERRSEFQSWHHLPTHRSLNATDNPRSHYTQPQKVKPLHFTIHPDWGP